MKLHLLVLILLGTMALGANATYAAEDDLVIDKELSSEIVKTSPITALFKSIFKKNVDERRENLERNRDIRNKLIEEHLEKNRAQFTDKNELNIKFNQKKEEIRTTETETLLIQFIDSIEKLDNIRDRIESRIAKFEENSIEVDTAKDFTLLATAKLESVKILIYDITSTTTDIENTASTTLKLQKSEILNEAIENIKEAREFLVEAINLLSTKMEIDVTASSTDPTLEEVEETNTL